MLTASLVAMRDNVAKVDDDDAFALAFARIENHYFVNGAFFANDNWLIEHVGAIRHLPCVIVQVCVCVCVCVCV